MVKALLNSHPDLLGLFVVGIIVWDSEMSLERRTTLERSIGHVKKHPKLTHDEAVKDIERYRRGNSKLDPRSP